MIEQRVRATGGRQSRRDQAVVIERLVENVKRAMQAEQVLDREGNATGEYTYQGNVANRAGRTARVWLQGKDGALTPGASPSALADSRGRDQCVAGRLSRTAAIGTHQTAMATKYPRPGGPTEFVPPTIEPVFPVWGSSD